MRDYTQLNGLASVSYTHLTLTIIRFAFFISLRM